MQLSNWHAKQRYNEAADADVIGDGFFWTRVLVMGYAFLSGLVLGHIIWA